MRRILCTIAAVVLLLSLCACGKTETPADTGKETEAEITAEEKEIPTVAVQEEEKIEVVTDGYTDATDYEIKLGEGQELTINNVRFNEDLIITGKNGKIQFCDCEFKGNIINKGGEGARVMLLNNITTHEGFKLVIDSEVKEATMETDLPKFMIFTESYPAECTNAGAIVTMGNMDISLNGENYPLNSCEYYMVESTGEFVEYEGQDAMAHNLAQWWENGEKIVMHIAVDE